MSLLEDEAVNRLLSDIRFAAKIMKREEKLYTVLKAIKEGAVTAKEISQATGLKLQLTYYYLDKLEALGFITCLKMGRKYYQLSQSGRELWEQMHPEERRRRYGVYPRY